MMTTRLKRFVYFWTIFCTIGAIFCGFAPSADSELVDRIVAVVNDDIILNSEMEEAMAPIREQLRESGYSKVQQDIALSDQRPYILEQLITEKLTDQQVKHFQIQISEAEIDTTIERVKEMNGLTDEQFNRKLELDGMTREEFRSEMKEKLLRTKLVHVEINSKIVITNEDIKAYYEKHRSRYAGQTQYHLRRILIKPGASDKSRDRVDDIRERLKAGESFVQLAVTYSEDRSAANGGDLGVFEERLLAPPIRDALAGLKKGQFSPVIDTEQGYQILYVEDLIHKDGVSFEEAKTEIQDKLYSEIVDQKFQNWLKDLREQAHIRIME